MFSAALLAFLNGCIILHLSDSNKQSRHKLKVASELCTLLQREKKTKHWACVLVWSSYGLFCTLWDLKIWSGAIFSFEGHFLFTCSALQSLVYTVNMSAYLLESCCPFASQMCSLISTIQSSKSSDFTGASAQTHDQNRKNLCLTIY